MGHPITYQYNPFDLDQDPNLLYWQFESAVVRVFARGGAVTLEGLRVHGLGSVWDQA